MSSVVTLLNQISNSEHHSTLITLIDGAGDRVTNTELISKAWIIDTFVSNRELRKSTPTCQFLKDDCVFFQVCMIHN